MNNNLELLLNILNMNQQTLADYIYNGHKNVISKYEKGSYIYGKGDTNKYNILLVAHLDTVNDNNYIYDFVEFNYNKITIKEEYINKINCLGGDDRCGVFIILNLLKNHPNIPFLFTYNEETSDKGVRNFKNQDLKNINLFIEFDKAGFKKYTTYDSNKSINTKHIIQEIENLGFEKVNGSYSDVQDLTMNYNIPHLNLSCAYYNQHSKTEFINIEKLFKTLDLAEKLILKKIV